MRRPYRGKAALACYTHLFKKLRKSLGDIGSRCILGGEKETHFHLVYSLDCNRKHTGMANTLGKPSTPRREIRARLSLYMPPGVGL